MRSPALSWREVALREGEGDDLVVGRPASSDVALRIFERLARVVVFTSAIVDPRIQRCGQLLPWYAICPESAVRSSIEAYLRRHAHDPVTRAAWLGGTAADDMHAGRGTCRALFLLSPKQLA
jgi:hypothetical protein